MINDRLLKSLSFHSIDLYDSSQGQESDYLFLVLTL